MSRARVVIAVSNSALRQCGLPELCSAVVKLSSKYEIVLAPAASVNLQPDLNTKHPQPLTYALAMQQGSTGYQFAQALDNELAKSHKAQKSTSLVTRVVVDRRDPAFRHPTHCLDQLYDAKTALRYIKTRGWSMQETPSGFQRLVASPTPIDIIEAKSIATLLQTGFIVIAMGCGGIPVTRTPALKVLKGAEAIVAPDLAAAKLAELIHADVFVSLIDLPNLYLRYKHSDQLPLGFITKRELSSFLAQDEFNSDISPKVQTMLDFVKPNRTSIIASPQNLELALARRAGTIIQSK